MPPDYARQLQGECRAELRAGFADLNTQLLAIHHLQQVAFEQPGLFEPESIQVVLRALESGRFARQRQGLFFYRQAAETLREVMLQVPHSGLAEQAFGALRRVLGAVSGHGHRAAAEALGGLPVAIHGPTLGAPRLKGVPRASWEQVLQAAGVGGSRTPVRFGRSLAVPADAARLLVVKLARADQPPEELLREALWLKRLQNEACGGGALGVPRPVAVDGSYLFRIAPLPPAAHADGLPAGRGCAIGFVADRNYFCYPNLPAGASPLGFERFTAVMGESACGFGRLTAGGIIHTAPIPLFHNRVQVHRRRDRGVYEWYRAGRLDRWLESCAYPNFGAGGLRDFEHLVAFRGDSLSLYRHIGSHLLSLLLVAGSYFRNLEPAGAGRAVDARRLFDPAQLKAVVCTVVAGYHRGFCGAEISPLDIPLDWDALVARMIDEMGVDRHMEEILRAADQQAMSEAEFWDFLTERGYRGEALGRIEKGRQDLIVLSGPHLGGFNQRISLPELIEAVETVSALCIAGRFFRERFGPSSPRRLHA
jgi:hypothetical protein